MAARESRAKQRTNSESQKRKVNARKNGGGQAASARAPARAVQISADQLPRKSLEQALRVARGLRDVYAGGPAQWAQIAEAMGISGGAQTNKYFLWSAQAYGLVEKEADTYSLSELGRKILAPTNSSEDKEALVRALMTPVIFSRFFTDYNGNPVPGEEHIGNVLEVRYGVPRERLEEAKILLRDNGLFVGILQQTEGGTVVRLDPATTGLPEPQGATPPEVASAELAGKGDGARAYGSMCFVITPIGEEDSEQRRHANMILKSVIEPVVAELGLSAVRADQIERAGLITKQIFECLARARICVADLSFNNPNAFYELGIRHMCKLPTVQMIRKGDRIPFDVAQGRTIKVDMTDVYTVMDSVESAKRELREHMKAALAADYKGEDNPVNTYLPGAIVQVPRA